MTRNDKITMLDQIQHLSLVNKALLTLAGQIKGDAGASLVDAVEHILTAGDIIIKLGEQPLLEETVNPQLN